MTWLYSTMRTCQIWVTSKKRLNNKPCRRTRWTKKLEWATWWLPGITSQTLTKKKRTRVQKELMKDSSKLHQLVLATLDHTLTKREITQLSPQTKTKLPCSVYSRLVRIIGYQLIRMRTKHLAQYNQWLRRSSISDRHWFRCNDSLMIEPTRWGWTCYQWRKQRPQLSKSSHSQNLKQQMQQQIRAIVVGADQNYQVIQIKSKGTTLMKECEKQNILKNYCKEK